jgi:hypothetical protein
LELAEIDDANTLNKDLMDVKNVSLFGLKSNTLEYC